MPPGLALLHTLGMFVCVCGRSHACMRAGVCVYLAANACMRELVVNVCVRMWLLWLMCVA